MGLEIVKRISAACAVVVLAACSLAGPSVGMANANGITITYDSLLYTNKALAMVEAHCAQYNKKPVLTMSNNRAYAQETYECK